MTLLDILSGRRSEDPLDAFDEKEAEDLSLHIRQCGRRYRSLDAKLDMVTRLVFVLVILYAMSNVAALKTLIGM